MRSTTGQSATRIAYCGPIAQPGQPARGGYESANRRLIDDLRRRGLDVLEFAYPVALGSKALKGLAYGRRFAAITAELVQQCRRYDVLHLTPLYRHFLYGEAALCFVAWSLGKKVLLDIRAGSFIRHYRGRSRVYRAVADTLIRRADLVAFEGKEHIQFAEARRDKPVIYLPNYVRPPVMSQPSHRGDAVARLVFLGRVVEEKGIRTAIDALRALDDMGIQAHLDVIGGGDEDYVTTLKHETANDAVTWHGALSPDAVRPQLASAHFFIFPTRHAGEGHSNALTEAMAEGVVPICSANGYNHSVVADAGRILRLSAGPDDYAKTIADLWRRNAWPALSAAARERVAQNFTSDAVVSGLIRHYAGAPVPSRP